ncbi:hypothetical protein [Candidatus Endomicrobiellum trichonymphae]|uniref:hypothetical protein n=1 Tax=Endomicrobium trichonymphae TaxID=1408204 RepID=UPI000BBB26ED|nr:hypothetical protein [Candidatus Endomicrobium trichonymphae]
MKKLIAGLMLLLMFVNVASAVKGVAPDAKTVSLLKAMGKKHSEILCNLETIKGARGFMVTDDGGKSGGTCQMECLSKF